MCKGVKISLLSILGINISNDCDYKIISYLKSPNEKNFIISKKDVIIYTKTIGLNNVILNENAKLLSNFRLVKKPFEIQPSV